MAQQGASRNAKQARRWMQACAVSSVLLSSTFFGVIGARAQAAPAAVTAAQPQTTTAQASTARTTSGSTGTRTPARAPATTSAPKTTAATPVKVHARTRAS
jgi:hypothetical protein